MQSRPQIRLSTFASFINLHTKSTFLITGILVESFRLIASLATAFFIGSGAGIELNPISVLLWKYFGFTTVTIFWMAFYAMMLFILYRVVAKEPQNNRVGIILTVGFVLVLGLSFFDAAHDLSVIYFHYAICGTFIC